MNREAAEGGRAELYWKRRDQHRQLVQRELVHTKLDASTYCWRALLLEYAFAWVLTIGRHGSGTLITPLCELS